MATSRSRGWLGAATVLEHRWKGGRTVLDAGISPHHGLRVCRILEHFESDATPLPDGLILWHSSVGVPSNTTEWLPTSATPEGALSWAKQHAPRAKLYKLTVCPNTAMHVVCKGTALGKQPRHAMSSIVCRSWETACEQLQLQVIHSTSGRRRFWCSLAGT